MGMTGAIGERSVDGIVLQRPRYDNKIFPFFSSFVLIKTKPPDKGWRSSKTAINQSLLFDRKKRFISQNSTQVDISLRFFLDTAAGLPAAGIIITYYKDFVSGFSMPFPALL